MDIQVITTGDGSHTLYVPSLNERFHSHHGAIAESLHVFINAGLKRVNKETITVFEIGFGTGLNALLSFMYATEKKIAIQYSAIDNNIIDFSTINQLNYPQLLGYPDSYTLITECEWNQSVSISENFTLHKIKADITTYPFNHGVDLIYYDAFGPETQPELWSKEILAKVCKMLVPGGFFVTYSAKGEVKRNLVSAGLSVEKLPGPPGKREMIRAFKPFL